MKVDELLEEGRQALDEKRWDQARDQFLLALHHDETSLARDQLQQTLLALVGQVRDGVLEKTEVENFVLALQREADVSQRALASMLKEAIHALGRADEQAPKDGYIPQPYNPNAADGDSSSAGRFSDGKYYPIKMIAWAGMVGGPLAGSILVALNYFRHRQPLAGLFASVMGAGFSFLLPAMLIVPMLPERFTLVGILPAFVGAAAPAGIAQFLQQDFVSVDITPYSNSVMSTTGLIFISIGGFALQLFLVVYGVFGLGLYG